jgi:hypothetical protein
MATLKQAHPQLPLPHAAEDEQSAHRLCGGGQHNRGHHQQWH